MKPSMRRDPQKEIDIKVSQELKNHKDFMYNTNQCLQNLSQAIVSLSLQYEKLVAKMGSDKNDLLISFQNMSEDVYEKLRDVQEGSSSCETDIYMTLTDVEFEIDKLEKNKANKCDVSFVEKMFDEILESLKSKLFETMAYQASEARKIKSDLKKEILDAKNDVLSQIPDLNPVVGDYCKKFSEFKVDIDGIILEFERIKKNIHYSDKKFENVYTLISRIKEGL